MNYKAMAKRQYEMLKRIYPVITDLKTGTCLFCDPTRKTHCPFTQLLHDGEDAFEPREPDFVIDLEAE